MRQFKNYEAAHNRKMWKRPEYFLDDKLFPIMIIEQDDTYMKSILEKDGCNISFIEKHGYGNGYVGLPLWHPWANKDYDELNEILDCDGNELTFSNLDPDKDFYWIGYDTYHPDMTQENWNKERMLKVCKGIIEQAKNTVEYQRIIKLKKIKKQKQSKMKIFNNTYYVRVLKTVWGNKVDNSIYEVDIICSEQDTDDEIKGMLMRKINPSITDIEYEIVNSLSIPS